MIPKPAFLSVESFNFQIGKISKKKTKYWNLNRSINDFIALQACMHVCMHAYMYVHMCNNLNIVDLTKHIIAQSTHSPRELMEIKHYYALDQCAVLLCPSRPQRPYNARERKIKKSKK